MAGERLYQTEGVVVGRRDQGDADRVLTLCTPLGKLSVIAKGVRKARSRKAGHLELFACSRIGLARSRSSWDVVSQADMIEAHAPLRGELVRGTYARYAVELYQRFVADGEGGPAIYELLKRTLGYLCREEKLELLIRAYEQRLLALVGFRPEWDHCVGEVGSRSCGRDLQVQDEERPFGLEPEQGGALCPDCYQAGRERRGVVPLSAGALQLLRACGREPFDRLRERPVTPPVLSELERAARHYITYHLEREVRTGTFLRRLRREAGGWPR